MADGLHISGQTYASWMETKGPPTINDSSEAKERMIELFEGRGRELAAQLGYEVRITASEYPLSNAPVAVLVSRGGPVHGNQAISSSYDTLQYIKSLDIAAGDAILDKFNADTAPNGHFAYLLRRYVNDDYANAHVLLTKAGLPNVSNLVGMWKENRNLPSVEKQKRIADYLKKSIADRKFRADKELGFGIDLAISRHRNPNSPLGFGQETAQIFQLDDYRKARGDKPNPGPQYAK